MVVRIREKVFSLLLIWLGYESRPKVRTRILCQPLLYPLPRGFFNKMRGNKFFMRPIEFPYEKVLLKGNIRYYSSKTEFHSVKYFSKTVPRKWTQENNDVVNHFKAYCFEVICVIFSSSPRSTLDAQLIAHRLSQ